MLYDSSSIADENHRYDNHRFPKGIHVTGTDTPSDPGIEELSCYGYSLEVMGYGLEVNVKVKVQR